MKKNMAGNVVPRRQYPEEFKVEAVRLAESAGQREASVQAGRAGGAESVRSALQRLAAQSSLGKRVSDTTFIRTREGSLYWAVILEATQTATGITAAPRSRSPIRQSCVPGIDHRVQDKRFNEPPCQRLGVQPGFESTERSCGGMIGPHFMHVPTKPIAPTSEPR